MKNKILLLMMILGSFLLVGCGKTGEKDVVKDFVKNIENANGYQLKGELEIVNNDDIYKYNVDVAYQKDNNYRVSMMNVSNQHEQIILKNADGVYVLTPSLNKSFKFQSEWPYNNSQSYLLQSLSKDMQNEADRKFEEVDGGYILTTKVNYPNNKKLINQKIYLDDKLNPTKVEVFDENGTVQIRMMIQSIDWKAKFKDNYFTLETNMATISSSDLSAPVSAIEDAIYPMYLPQNTRLASQERVEKPVGERIIMTFEGDSPFMLIEETATIEDEFTIIPTYGDPDIVMGTFGAVSSTSVNFISDGIEYYLVSDVLSQQELLTIASSIGTIPVAK